MGLEGVIFLDTTKLKTKYYKNTIQERITFDMTESLIEYISPTNSSKPGKATHIQTLSRQAGKKANLTASGVQHRRAPFLLLRLHL